MLLESSYAQKQNIVIDSSKSRVSGGHAPTGFLDFSGFWINWNVEEALQYALQRVLCS